MTPLPRIPHKESPTLQRNAQGGGFFLSKHRPRRGLGDKPHRDAEGFVNAVHILRRDLAGTLAQAAFVQRADLFGQDDAVLGQAAAVGPHPDVGRQAIFILPRSDGRRNDGGAVLVADLILDDKYRPPRRNSSAGALGT